MREQCLVLMESRESWTAEQNKMKSMVLTQKKKCKFYAIILSKLQTKLYIIILISFVNEISSCISKCCVCVYVLVYNRWKRLLLSYNSVTMTKKYWKNVNICNDSGPMTDDNWRPLVCRDSNLSLDRGLKEKSLEHGVKALSVTEQFARHYFHYETSQLSSDYHF